MTQTSLKIESLNQETPRPKQKATGHLPVPRGEITEPAVKALRAARRGAGAAYTYYYEDLFKSSHR
ncbi:MAG: hypothetical protein FVQ06_01695 [candidate division NC10 bacterium]|nr:hypothetical protein [candidate division NC10 bacterium]